MATADVIQSYGAAWNTDDEAERRKLLEAAWAEDGVYCDPVGRAEGLEALVTHIGGTQGVFPGHRIEMTSGVDEHDGQFRFTWEMRGPDGATVLEGIDFGTLSPDGRIASITGFFGPIPPS